MTPQIGLTLGDVAGVGPEVAIRAALDERVRAVCKPILVGDQEIIERTIERCGLKACLFTPSGEHIGTPVVCWRPGEIPQDVWDHARQVPLGRNDARAGRAAYEMLVSAAKAAIHGTLNAIVTAPISKAALHLAGLKYPGHTEILAEVCGVRDFGMMLFLPPNDAIKSPHGLGVVHVTLHTSLRSVPDLITTVGVIEKIELINSFMRRVGCTAPRIAVCALNPHAGEEGIFGDEESQIIAPAVRTFFDCGLASVIGPLPADTLFRRAAAGEFDAVVAMYHDQGHIAFKLLGFQSAVNVTLGLPIVRTSPSHGTAFDIVGKSPADPSGMIEAVLIAAKLTRVMPESREPHGHVRP